MSMINHQEQPEKDHQEVLFSMDKSLKNPNKIDHLPSPLSSSSSQDFETSSLHQHNIIHGANETHEQEEIKKLENPDEQLNTSYTLKNGSANSFFCSPQYISHTIKDGHVINPSCSFSPLVAGEEDKIMPPPPPSPQEVPPMVEESGRDRLKRHRENMAGQVWIPDIWGHEDFLKDWIDCTVFDSSLGNKTIMSARAALVQEGRSTLRIHNQC